MTRQSEKLGWGGVGWGGGVGRAGGSSRARERAARAFARARVGWDPVTKGAIVCRDFVGPLLDLVAR